MELLLSNIPPVRLSKRNTISCFEELMRSSDAVKIASGYISTDALTELKKRIELNKSFLELIIGMHGFEGFTRPQYQAAVYLDNYLKEQKIGLVKVAKTFKFHGKVYSFLRKEKAFAGIIGSSNLSSILDNRNVYEADICVTEPEKVKEIDGFVDLLSDKACVPLSEIVPIFIEDLNWLLEGHEGVEKITNQDLSKVISDRTKISFKIPIKTSSSAGKSNLNVYFGKGRENKSKKDSIKLRHWYEVELIVSKDITDLPGYPKKGQIFTVYTDDNWKFRCKVSGDYSKNLRSADDLKVLGRWIKGRLENNGSLKVGELVADETLKHYGRDNFELTATKDPSVWYLNFGV